MNVVCSKNETIIKSWDYATAAQGRGEADYNLTLTDKRLIHITKTRNGVKRKEISTDSVVSVDTEYAYKRAWKLSLFLILLGVLIATTGFFLPIERVFIVIMCIGGLGVSVAGLALFIAGMRVRFSLVVCYRTGTTAEAAFSADTMRKTPRATKGKLHLTVDGSCAGEIVEVIGALLLVDSCQK